MFILQTKKARFTFAAISVVCAILLALSMFPAAALAAEPEFEIIYPSSGESVITPGRDFYIIGTAPSSELKDKNITVELFRSGETLPVRSLQSSDTLDAAYDKAAPALDNQFTDDISAADTGMPDLVYDTKIEGSETDSTKKIAVTENNFCALILGGCNNDGLTAQGSMLTKGDYTIKVTLASGKTATKDITIATTPDKTLMRYSPDEHYKKASAYAKENGWRMYVDPFPGYWSPVGGMDGNIYYNGAPFTDDIFIESFSRWRFADGLEYETGNVHLLLYNINSTCASECVEVAALQRTYRVDTELYCYYYDIGEPSIAGDSETLEGELIPMKQGDKLELTRAQTCTEAEADNKFAAYEKCECEIDADVGDGINADEGETLEIFGVTAPIQNTSSQLASDGKNGYTIENHISSVRYVFSDGDKEIYTDTREVGLDREYTEGKTASSIYEFKHVFALEGKLASGSFSVTAEALDSAGRAVEGGSETFMLTVDGGEVYSGLG